MRADSEANLRVTDGPTYWTQKEPNTNGKHRTRRATVKRPRFSALWIIAAILLATDASLGQQQADGDQNGRESLEVPLLRAVPVPAADRIDLDGFLTEAAWSGAAPTTTFTQQEPTEGAQPTEASEVRVVIDGDALYIGAMFFDDPDGVLAYQKRRDEGLGTDDRFMWILDTFLDGRTGYFFEINPAGLMGDGLLREGGRINKAWDGVWEARVQRLDNGWSAEIRIPWSTLNFDPTSDTWGINFQRTIRRKQEEVLWAGHRRTEGLFRPIHAGRLTGLRDMSQGLGLEVKPYAVAGWTDQTMQSARASQDVGVDLAYSITPSLRAAASLNTDFAEVEVDQRRVNLTRFPLRFPEQRDFFLEGSGVYNFAPRNGVEPYFSRRIGLREGNPVPVRFGTRLGGQAGRYQLGFLQVGTEDHLGIEGEDFTVARVKRQILAESTIGAIYTRRAGGAEASSVRPADDHTVGVDMDLRTSRFLGDKNLQVDGFFVWNSNPEPTIGRTLSDLSARGFRIDFPNDIWEMHLSYREFGSFYDPAIGFVTRNGFRRVEPNITWRPRPDSSWIRQYRFGTQFRYLASIDTGRPEERQWRFDLLGIDFENSADFNVRVTSQFEHLDRAFEISDGVVVQPGGYQTLEWEVTGSTPSQKPISLDADIGGGGFWNGDRFGYELGLEYRPAAGVELGLEYERNEVSLPQGAFDTNLVRLNTAWDISPWSSITSNVQYDNVSEIIGLFLKTRWIIAPGNDLYLVYTQNWQNLRRTQLDPHFTGDQLDPRFTTLSRGLSTKLNYTFRF